ncbi:MAG: hypothetical protein GX571_06265, partial [Lentisphaerae bacterium]|nr:hypothetical protein [Lentisphaerota bacterium]
MNTCACETRLTSWLLGDLPPAEAETLRRHVAECAACRTLARELEPVVAALRQGLADAPAKAPRLYPAQRRRVLATPYHTRFRRWWSGSHRGLRLAASLTLAAGFVWLAIKPAFHRVKRPDGAVSSCDAALYCLEAPMALMERSDLAPLNIPKSLPGSSAGALREPVVPAYEPDIDAKTPAPPPAAASPISPQPQAFDTVMKVKSPVILHNIYGRARTAGMRGALVAGKGEAKQDAEAPPAAGDDDLGVVVSFGGAGKPADSSRPAALAPAAAVPPTAEAEAEEETARLREEVAILEGRAVDMSSRIKDLIGAPPGGGEATRDGRSSRSEG